MKIIFSLRFSALAFCFGLLLHFSLLAADTPKTAVNAVDPENKKLTPAQQKGLALLREAEVSASQLSPEMRIVILTKISDGYEKFSPERRIELLRDAFQASTLISDPSCPGDLPCGDKINFQTNILQKLAWLSPNETEKLLPQIHPYVRRVVMERLVDNYIWRGNYDHAEQLLVPYEEAQDFPYPTVMSLMRALPASRAADKVVLFNTALSNFRRVDHKRNYGSPDLGDVVLQFWQQLPPDLVLQATDTLLEEGKRAASGPENIQRDISAGNGHLSLDSYQYRVFQLLPVLREIDANRADILLREQKQLNALTAKYPNGLASFSPAMTGHGGTSYDSYSMSSTQRSVPLTDKEIQFKKLSDTLDDQEHAVQALQGNDPDRAFKLALAIPLWGYGDDPRQNSPRANAMLGLANACIKTKPAIALQALQEAQKAMDEVAPSAAMQILTQSGDLYLEAGKQNELQLLLRRGGKLAEKYYAMDSNDADPNQAPKREWPSTDCWRRVIVLAAQISPEVAEQWISRIPNGEIQTMEKVAYGSALLGVTDSVFSVTENHKRYSRSFGGN